MLQIRHDGIHFNADLNTDGFTGNAITDSELEYVKGLKGGRLAAVDADGFVALADGDPANGLHPMGFIINDASGYGYENKPAIASLKVPLVVGASVLITDEIDLDLTFAPGELLYCGTSTKIGLLTNVAPDPAALVVGIALSAASAASPELMIFVK